MWSGLICTLILLRISRTVLMSFCTLSCFGVLVGLSLIPYNTMFNLRSGVCWIRWVVLIGPLILTPELVDCQFYQPDLTLLFQVHCVPKKVALNLALLRKNDQAGRDHKLDGVSSH